MCSNRDLRLSNEMKRISSFSSKPQLDQLKSQDKKVDILLQEK